MGEWKADDGSIFFTDGTWIRLGDRLKAEVVVSKQAAEVDALTAERDRLAAENAELRSDAIRDAGIECRLKAELAAANATLDRLRDVVPKGWHWCADCEKMTPPDDEDPDFCGVCESENYWHRGVHVALQTILYPPETTNDDR